MAKTTVGVNTKFKGFDIPKRYKEEFMDFMETVHEQAVYEAEDIVREEVPNSGGNRLMDSVVASYASTGKGKFTTEIEFEDFSPEAIEAIEFGRSPDRNPPPVDDIITWMKTSGIEGNPYFTARKIGREGTEGRRFLTTTRRLVERNTRNLYRREANAFRRSKGF